MSNNLPHIHLFESIGKYYFYDVNKHKTVNISKEIYDILQKQLHDGIEPNNLIIQQLKSDGFLSANRVEKIEHPADNILVDILNNKVKKICLQLTQQCNFRCNYCVYSGNYENRNHATTKMSPSLAKAGIDFLLGHAKDSPTISVGFYGGEPLLEFELIKECMEYTNKVAEGKKIAYSMTTNGSLLNNEMVETFLKYDATVAISLDGPSDIHNKNRKFASNGKGTYEIVYNNIIDIMKKYPEFRRKIQYSMVIDPTVQIGCINEFIATEDELFGQNSISSTLVNGLYRKDKIASTQEFFQNWEYEKFKYYLFLLGRLPENKSSRLMNNSHITLLEFISKSQKIFYPLSKNDHHSGPCIPGQVRLFMNTEGDFYPCERVNETSEVMKIGNIKEGFDFDKIRALLNIGTLTESECKDCFAFRGCYLCAAYADESSELSKNKKMISCNTVRYNFEEMLKNAVILKELGISRDKIQLLRDL